MERFPNGEDPYPQDERERDGGKQFGFIYMFFN